MLGPTNRCAKKKYIKKQRKITTMREAGSRKKQEEFLHVIDYIFNCHILCEIRETISSVK